MRNVQIRSIDQADVETIISLITLRFICWRGTTVLKFSGDYEILFFIGWRGTTVLKISADYEIL
jgi:hypothetical protein